MLRTAQEIIDECFEKLGKEALIKEIYIMAVNTAVREAIEECAESATMISETEYDIDGNGYEFTEVNKQSILDLIHQIK